MYQYYLLNGICVCLIQVKEKRIEGVWNMGNIKVYMFKNLGKRG